MSFTLQENQEDCLNDLKSLLIIPQRTWKNTWSFNLHEKLPLDSVYDNQPSTREILKKGIRKYYGRKIQYVIKFKDLNACISHSKLVKSAEIQENSLFKNSLKIKGNLVIFGINVKIQGEQKLLCFKKILKHCQKAAILTRNGQNIWLFEEMLSLRNLYIEISTPTLLSLFGGIFCHLLNLEQMTVKYMRSEGSRKSNSCEFFSQFEKVPHLKKLRLICNYKALENMKQDLEKFYEKPFNFAFSIKIYLDGVSLGKNGDLILELILTSAEYLCIEYWEDARQFFDEISIDLCHEVKKKMGKRNIVELSIENSKNTSKTLLSICSQINQRSPSLKHLSLYLRGLSLTDQFCLENKQSSFNENFSRALEEISACDKINVLKLLINVEDLNPIVLGKILSNKSLEVFQMNLYSQKVKFARKNWDKCFMIAAESKVKELFVKIPKGEKIRLFDMNLLNYVKSLDSLQIVELVDENLEVIACEFLQELVKSLLEKKGMRKFLICTKIVKNFYVENFGKFFSKILGAQRKNKLDEVFEDWEKRVETLKSLQLEEILVGKLSGGRFSYLLFNRKVEVTEKLFWTQTEMEDLLISQKELKDLYPRIFYLLLENEAIF